MARTEGARGRSGSVAAAIWISGTGEGPVEKSHRPMGAKGELLGPGHHQERPLATQGAEEKDKWAWQRRPPMWAAKLQQQGMGPWHEQEAPFF